MIDNAKNKGDILDVQNAPAQPVNTSGASSGLVDDLVPWGRLLSGQRGISANRLAKALGVSPKMIKQMASPIGCMKIPYRAEFNVYDAALVKELAAHPAILKARNRRSLASARPRANIAALRKERCIQILSERQPELRPLFSKLVNRLWNPRTEASLTRDTLYTRVAALLFEGLAPKRGNEEVAMDIVVNILWAATKTRTWKVDRETESQHVPRVYEIWERECRFAEDPDLYEDVFAAAIRHMYFNERATWKWRLRERAVKKLQEISSRDWPSTSLADGAEEEGTEASRCSSSLEQLHAELTDRNS